MAVTKWAPPVVQPQFGWANGFREGLASVEVAPRKYGFIDTTGRLVIPARFDEGGFFAESLAVVGINHKLGYIDRSGNVAIKSQFSQAAPFTGGLARVMLQDAKLACIDKSCRLLWREK